MGICSVCNKYLGLLSREFNCCICGRVVCRECRTKIPNDEVMELLLQVHHVLDRASSWDGSFSVCSNCIGEFGKRYSKMKDGLSDTSSVKIYTINYQGKIPKGTYRIKIESDWFRDRNEALVKLKAMATYLDYRQIVEVRFDKDTGSEPSENGKGTHYYTIWQASGYAVK